MNVQTVLDALTKIVTDIVNFIPRLINGLIILFIGLLVARGVRWIVRQVLVRLRFDALVERVGLTSSLRNLGIKTKFSDIVAQAFFTLLLLSFTISATRLMGLEPVSQLLEQLLAFLPNIIAAGIIFLLGAMAAQFVGSLVTAAATASGLRDAARVGRIVQYLLSLFVVILTLGQLGIDTSILVTTVTIVIAAFGLAVGLGLGLGGRQIVYHLFSGYYVRQRFPVGQRITIGDIHGDITNVSGVNTVVATEHERIVIPNGVLLDAIVHAPQPTVSHAPADHPEVHAPQPTVSHAPADHPEDR